MMNEASSYVANLHVEELEKLLAAKKAEASTIMQLNPATEAGEILPSESQPHKHNSSIASPLLATIVAPQTRIDESLEGEVGAADVMFSTPSRSRSKV